MSRTTRGGQRPANDTGLIVGGVAAAPPGDPWLRSVSWAGVGAQAADLGTLGGPYGGALAVNAFGLIADGSANATQSGVRATLWNQGTITGLATNPPGYGSTVRGLSDSGIAVGYEQTAPLAIGAP